MKIWFLRHSKADHNTDNHRISGLSEEGRSLAQRRAQEMNLPDFPPSTVFCSGLLRTRQTASIMTGVEESQILEMTELFGPEDGSEIRVLEEVFGELGHSPLNDYFAYSAEVRDALRTVGQKGYRRALMAVERLHPGVQEIFVVGHGVILPAIGFAYGGEDHRAKKLFGDLSLKECEGFILHLHPGGALAFVQFLLERR
jgi:broad specificity phosphatase PhoE